MTIRAENLQNLTAVCIIMDTNTNLNYTLSVTSKNNTHIVCNTTEVSLIYNHNNNTNNIQLYIHWSLYNVDIVTVDIVTVANN